MGVIGYGVSGLISGTSEGAGVCRTRRIRRGSLYAGGPKIVIRTRVRPICDNAPRQQYRR